MTTIDDNDGIPSYFIFVFSALNQVNIINYLLINRNLKCRKWKPI